jgi:hypothetical protein
MLVALPGLKSLARQAIPRLLEAVIIPLALFYATLAVFGLNGALAAALAAHRPGGRNGQRPPVGGRCAGQGEGAVVKEGDTKTAKPHVVDIDAATVALLKAYKRERGGMALQLARDDALVFGDQEGNHRHPERFSRGSRTSSGAARGRSRRPAARRYRASAFTTSATPTPRSSSRAASH